MQKIVFVSACLLLQVYSNGQKLKKGDVAAIDRLKKDIQFLASDDLKGRRVGTESEKVAASYISKQFQDAGVSPKGAEGYFQDFEINDGKEISPSSFLKINGRKLELMKDYFPVSTSPNASFSSSPSIALMEPGMPWFYDLKELLEENKANPHFDMNAAIVKAAKKISRRGGSSVFIYNTSAFTDGIAFNRRDMSDTLAIPVIYLSPSIAKEFLKDPSAILDIESRISINVKTRIGRNIVGFIDNGAKETVVIGAHYDHLGMGEDGNSRETSTIAQIYNGADDNASGTAGLIELGRELKTLKSKHQNYLLIAFSGEELGLFGSKFYVDHPTIDLTLVNYMINMDMIGRLNDSSRTVTVGGYGTSPRWGEIYQSGLDKKFSQYLKFIFDSSGTGPSDHTSFYRKNIPVLFYFTGLHPDYHKASDDFDKLNFTGEYFLLKHVMAVVEATDKSGAKLVFTKTREVQMSTNAKFSVTLGIMPDYTFPGEGVRADGVSDDRPAQRAGVKAGDIIVSMGGVPVKNLEDYMQGLSRYKKGDKTQLVLKRAKETITTEVIFN